MASRVNVPQLATSVSAACGASLGNVAVCEGCVELLRRIGCTSEVVNMVLTHCGHGPEGTHISLGLCFPAFSFAVSCVAVL